VATRIVSACRDPATPLRRLANIIECDVGYASRLLRMANSSMYGLTGSIRTVKQALVVLGLRQVRNLALTLAGAELFEANGSGAELMAELWSHSLGCAAVARLLAGLSGSVDPEEAFLAGIFHDAGKLVLLDLAADDYAPLLAEHSGERLCQAESDQYNVTHAQLGQHCGQFWGLPPEVTEAIGKHHDAAGPLASTDMATCLAAANQLARLWAIGAEQPQGNGQAASGLIETLGLEPDDAENVRKQAAVMFAELRDACA